MKKFKIISLLLAAFAALCLMSGCSGTETAESTDTEEEIQEVQETEEATDQEEAQDEDVEESEEAEDEADEEEPEEEVDSFDPGTFAEILSVGDMRLTVALYQAPEGAEYEGYGDIAADELVPKDKTQEIAVESMATFWRWEDDQLTEGAFEDLAEGQLIAIGEDTGFQKIVILTETAADPDQEVGEPEAEAGEGAEDIENTGDLGLKEATASDVVIDQEPEPDVTLPVEPTEEVAE